MFAFLNGQLVERDVDRVVLDVMGVGYEVFVSLNTYQQLGDENGDCKLFIHQHVREDALKLFGFFSREEKKYFEVMLGVSGIGPKLALVILSTLSPEQLSAAVQNENLSVLQKIPGIGRKTAERLLIELRDKVRLLPLSAQTKPLSVKAASSEHEDVLAVLVSLGYKPAQAQTALDKVLKQNTEQNDDLENLLKKCLVHI